MKASQELIDFVEDLRKEARDVRATRQTESYNDWVDAGKLNGLAAGCRLLIAKLGPFGKVWDQMLRPPANYDTHNFEKISAVLDSIATALAKGRLATIEEMVSAEVLGDLLEHAEELLKAKYNLAAAIILRAVLEERLRKLCSSNHCLPTAVRPTIEHFKQSLSTAQVIDRLVVKDIDWMAGVGNAAAHNLPEYNADDVPQLYHRLTAFLTRFSTT
jgi:hypothetical protein